ncbi:enhancer of mRNA-decapping protein 3 [Entomortierella parvispora]|uniref:Enhancer of mRNA-decapping protein 3 n=1 Tax=Entomortierella parvispora TaxID=205924 RepID=A0A9P3M1V1_9FUNG|nr:enhancer of mRNA-decapping protein 3 [Entomortierella parvispora]
MAAAFIGLSVKVLMTNGTSLKGHVADVNQNTQRLMLQDVVIQFAGDPTVRVMTSFSIAGGEIQDLQVLPTQPAVHPPSRQDLDPSSPTVSTISVSTTRTSASNSTVVQGSAAAGAAAVARHQMHQQHETIHAPLVAPSPSQLPAHPHPNAPVSAIPYHDPAIISFKHPGNVTPSQQSQQQQHTRHSDNQTVTEKLSSTKIRPSSRQQQQQSHHQHNNDPFLTVAESSATESVSRGPRRNRRSNNMNNHSGSNNYNNNMSDYGSPRTPHQTVHGKRTARRNKEPIHEWAQRDSEDFKDEDFDFQSNLGLFDKARVFAEIREADDTAPESLLVNLNRNPDRARAMGESPMLRKLLPTENVLDPAPNRRMGYGSKKSTQCGNEDASSSQDEDDGDESDEEEEDDDGNDSWNSSSVEESTLTPGTIAVKKGSAAQGRANGIVPSVTALEIPASVMASAAAGGAGTALTNGLGHDGVSSGNTSASGVKKRSIKIQTLSGVACPAVTSAQMLEVERLSASEMGLSDEQLVENGGRGAAMMCLQALGGSRRIQPNNHNSAPVVVILAGNNRTGAYALCAARHLSNHGCLVQAFLAGSNHEGQLHAMVAAQTRGFLATGGEILHTIAELPQAASTPVDIIVDGLLGYQFTVRDLVDSYERETVCDLMDWANDNKAPVLSLDMPSGVDGTTGEKTDKGHKFCIRPKWTLCLGAPKTGCRSRAITGELFMTDLGIPRACWKRAGVKGWSMPWGADFLVGLEYL